MSKSISADLVQQYRQNGYRVVKGANGAFYAYPKATKKKSKKIVTYEQNGKTKKVTSRTILVTKKGKFNEEAISVLEKIVPNPMDLDDAIWELHKTNKKVNWKNVQAFLIDNKVGRYLINLGIDIDDLVEECMVVCPEVTKEYILDSSHWIETRAYKVDGPLTLPNGLKVNFYWDYNQGSTFKIEETVNEN